MFSIENQRDIESLDNKRIDLALILLLQQLQEIEGYRVLWASEPIDFLSRLVEVVPVEQAWTEQSN